MGLLSSALQETSLIAGPHLATRQEPSWPWPMTDPIYRRPEDYDLEHEGDERDIEFYRELVVRLRPRRMLELARRKLSDAARRRSSFSSARASIATRTPSPQSKTKTFRSGLNALRGERRYGTGAGRRRA
jgi:hypothetical protein